MKTKRLSIAFFSFILLIVLAACGQTQNAQNAQTPNTQSSTDPASAGASASAAANSDTAGLASAGQESAADSAASSDSAAADNILQNNPNARVASISIHITNNLLALGITPVGSVIGGDVKDFLPHVKDRLQNAVKYGTVADPDMEALLASKPDVIFLDEQYSGKDISKFEQIAPTISIDTAKGTWQDQLMETAKHFSLEQQADTFTQNYADKAQRVSKLVKSKLGDNAKVMAIRSTAKELRVMGMGHPMGPIMFEDLGLTPANGVEKIDGAYDTISQEVLPDFDADAIFVIISTGNAAKANFEALEANPLWSGLKAVKNHHVYVLDGQKWLDYSSLGQDMALDDAEQLFSK